MITDSNLQSAVLVRGFPDDVLVSTLHTMIRKTKMGGRFCPSQFALIKDECRARGIYAEGLHS